MIRVPCDDLDEPGAPGWEPPGWNPPNPCPGGKCKPLRPGPLGRAIGVAAAAAGAALLTGSSQTDQEDEPRRYLYHYTDIDGYTAILATRILNPSGVGGRGHATQGIGQYFTDLPPTGVLTQLDYALVLFNVPSAQFKVRFWILVDVANSVDSTGAKIRLRPLGQVYAFNLPPKDREVAARYNAYIRDGRDPISVRLVNDGPTIFRPSRR